MSCYQRSIEAGKEVERNISAPLCPVLLSPAGTSFWSKFNLKPVCEVHPEEAASVVSIQGAGVFSEDRIISEGISSLVLILSSTPSFILWLWAATGWVLRSIEMRWAIQMLTYERLTSVFRTDSSIGQKFKYSYYSKTLGRSSYDSEMLLKSCCLLWI